MSQSDNAWWEFLQRWSSSFSNNEDFDWLAVATELEVDRTQVREFLSYFKDDVRSLKHRELEVCIGSSCMVKGALAIWQRIESANKGRVPEMKILLKSSACLGECDRAPCAREAHKFYVGDDKAWLARIEAE